MVKVKEDLTGRRFGKLVVLEQADDYVSPSGNRYPQWLCKCDCGNVIVCLKQKLTKTKFTHCGCELLKEKNWVGFKVGQWEIIGHEDTLQGSLGSTEPRWIGRCMKCGRTKLFKTTHLQNPECTYGTKCSCNTIAQREGLISYNMHGLKMTVIKYRNSHDIDVEFDESKYVVKHAQWHNFTSGNIADPLSPTLYGVGIKGDVAHYDGTGRPTQPYKAWIDILKRCYDEDYLAEHPTYETCTVCKEWLSYKNFLVWYQQNLWDCKGCSLEVDKDYIRKGNKCYCPEMCCLVPHRINSLIVKMDARRGEYPIGVTYDSRTGLYIATVAIDGKNQIVGRCHTVQSAFDEYKVHKERYVKQVADEYKAKYPDFPQKLYDAMYAYEVEITD